MAYKDSNNPASGEVHWLRDRDMLPSRFPDARILTYDWNADFDKEAVQEGLHSQAEHLVDQIDKNRNEVRPTNLVESAM